MKLRLELKLNGLGDQTHVWFPIPKQYNKEVIATFSIPPRTVEIEKKFQNVFAYYCFDDKTATLSMTVGSTGDRGRDEPTDRELMFSNNVQSTDRNIRRISYELTRNASTTEEKAKKCFDWVVGYLVYDHPIRGLYSSLQALTDRHVDCGGFSTLLVALLRSIRIPARCVFGWARDSRSGYHAWVEHYDENKKGWIPSDPSVVHLGKRTKLRAGFGFIDDPRIAVSVGEDLMLDGVGIQWGVPLFQTPVIVSITAQNIPVAIEESLQWKWV